MAALDRIQIAAIGDTAEDLAEQARAAEAAGIDCVWTPELFRSSVTQATWLAAKTEQVGVATGIAWAFTRSAFILAVTALDIDEMSGRALPARPRRRRQAPERDLARRRVRQARAASARDDRGDAADHAAGPERRADPLRGRVRGDRHQGLDPPPQGGSRAGADLHRGDAGGHVPDGGRRRRRPDRPPDVPAALGRRGRGPELREGPRRAPAANAPTSTSSRPSAARSTTTRAARSTPRAGRSPSTPPSAPTGRSGRCTASPTRPRRPGTPSASGDLAAVPEAIPDEMVDAYTAAGPLDKVRARVEEVAERGDGVWLTPPTYFIPPEQIARVSGADR